MNKQQKKIAKKLPTKRNNKHGDKPLKDSDLPVNEEEYEEDDDIRKAYESYDKDIKEAEDKGDYKHAIKFAKGGCTSLEAKEKDTADYINDLIYISNDDEAWRRWHKDERHKYIDIKSLISECEGKLRAIRTQKEKYEQKLEELGKKLADKQAEEVDEPAQPHISRSWDEFLKDYAKELPASFDVTDSDKSQEFLRIINYYQNGATDKRRLNNYLKKKDAKAPTFLKNIVEKLIERNKANKKELLTVKDLETPETKPVIDPDEYIKFGEDLQASQLPQELKDSLWDKVSIMQRLVDQGKRDKDEYVAICDEIKFILKLKPEEQKYTETVDRLNELLDKWLKLPNDKQNEYKKIQEEMAKEREKLKMHHTQTMPVKDVDKEKKKLIDMINLAINSLKNTELNPKDDRDVTYKRKTEHIINAYKQLLKEKGDDPNNIDVYQLEKIFGEFDAAREEYMSPKLTLQEKKLLNTFKIHLRSLQAKIDKGEGITEKERRQLNKEFKAVCKYDDDFRKQVNNDRKYAWMWFGKTKEPPAVNRSSSALKTLDKVPEKIKAPTKRRADSSSKKIPEEKLEDTESLKKKNDEFFYNLFEKPMMREEFNSYNMDNYLSSLEERFEEKSRDPAFNKLSNTEKDKVIREILTMKDIKYDKMRTAISNEIKSDPSKFKNWFNKTVAPLLGVEIDRLASNARLSKVKTTGITGMTFVFKDKEKKAEAEPTPAPAPAPKPMKIGKSKKSGGIMKGASVGNAKTFFSYDIHEIFKIIESKLHLTLSKYAKLSIEALIYNATDEIINSHGCSDSGHGSSIYDDIVSDVEDYINQHSKSSETFHFMGQRRQQFITILKSEVKNNKQQRNRDMDDRIAALSNFL